MDQQIKELLRPELINSVNGLELLARIIAEGFMSGITRSQSVGAGQEFSQYRGYQPGDDLRRLDWKMFARSERYYIRESEIETNITVRFVLDATASMGYEENQISKLRYASLLIAALAYLARKQSDTFGLTTLSNGSFTEVHPRFEQQQFLRILHALAATQPSGSWPVQGTSAFRHHRKELILVFSDLYDSQDELLQFVSRLRTSDNEVIVFHILGNTEMHGTWEGSLTFEDLETGVRVKADAQQLKEYSREVTAWTTSLRSQLLEKRVEYFPVVLTDEPEKVLYRFLMSRKKLARA